MCKERDVDWKNNLVHGRPHTGKVPSKVAARKRCEAGVSGICGLFIKVKILQNTLLEKKSCVIKSNKKKKNK